MCGIAGFWGDDNPHLLSSMVAAIASRGPDHQDTYIDQDARIGLGHTRLSIIDLSTASNQPLWNSSHEACIVFNGEIYNYRELRKKLIGLGYRFLSNGDAEVLLNAYLAYGMACLNLVNGIFSFAIWDRSRRKMIIARDHYGVKPLYYAQTGQSLYFASEIKSLMQCTRISRDIDTTAIRDYLTFLWCPEPRTPLQHVRKLEPGTYLQIDAQGTVSTHRYYRLGPGRVDVAANEVALIEQFRDTFGTAVQRQLVSDVPVGAFLSGGLDSSAIAYYASKLCPDQTLKCFTIEAQGGKQEGMIEDLPYAKQVASHLGVELDIVKVDSSLLSDLAGMVYTLDEPQADPAALNASYICAEARRQGIKVLLSGAGGDDLLTGYRRHLALQHEGLWSRWPQSWRKLLKHMTARLPKHMPLSRRVAKAFSYADWPEQERLISYFFWLDPGNVQNLFAPDVLADIRERTGSRMLERMTSDLPGNASALEQMLYLDTKYFLVDHNLNYTDKMSMQHGVEVRVPFLDRDFVEFANAIPMHYKQKGHHGKWIFKRAMEGLLPDNIIYRPKTGFGAPVRDWLRGELKPLMLDLLSADNIKRRGLFNPQAVSSLIAMDQAGKVDAAYTLMSLMCIELWLQQFIDPRTPQRIAA